jgi:hypothetical protein
VGLVRLIDAATGQPVEVDEAEASPRIARGELLARGPGRVVGRDGAVFEVDDVGAALSQRAPDGTPVFDIDTPGRAEERRLEREYGSSPIRAGAAGAARGLTLGLSDVAGAGLGHDEALRELQARNEEASIAGEVVGSAAPILLSGGLGAAGEVGLLARGARAVGAPVRALSAFSSAAGSATARTIAGTGAGFGRRLAARGAGATVEGAIEGAAYAGGQMVSEEALGTGDPNLTAEGVIARLGYGALLGGGAGGVLGGGIGLAGEGVRFAREGAEVISRSWASRVGTELDPAVAGALGHAIGGDGADVLRRLAAGGDDSRRVLEVIERGDHVYEAGVRSLREEIDGLIRTSTHVEDFARGSLKRDAVRGRIDGRRTADQIAYAEQALARARQIAEQLQTDPVYVQAGVARGRDLARTLERFDDLRLRNPSGQVRPHIDASELYIRLDQLKRQISQMQRQTGFRDPEAARALQGLYDDMIGPLENPALWGSELATMQREVNQRWTRYLSRADEFDGLFAARGPRDDIDPWRSLREADPASLDTFLRGAGLARNDRRMEIFHEVLDARADLSRSIAQHMDVPENLAAEVAGSSAAIERVRRTVDEAIGSARIANQWREASAAVGTSRGIGGAISGALYAGAPGALVGAVGPHQSVRVLSTVQRLARQTDEGIGASIRRFLGRASGAARVVGARAARAGVAAERTGIAAGAAGARAAYARWSKEIDDHQQDRTRIAARMAESTRAITHDAPRVQQSMQTAGVRALEHLAMTRPLGQTLPGQLVSSRSEPALADVRRWAARIRVVEDPLSVLADLERGSLTPEAVETLRTVYPAIYAQIGQRVMEVLAESGTSASYQERLRLGTLLGIPTDPSLSPEILAILQTPTTAPAPTQTSQAPTHRAPDLAGSMASETQRLEARRS